MLHINLWTEVGLVNGAVGYVREICYKSGDRPPALPKAVMVQFDNFAGPFYKNNAWVPILPIKKYWTDGSNKFWRLQIPLTIANALTVHKSQGITLDRAVIEIGDRESHLGQKYVALSRVKTLDGLFLSRPIEKSRFDNFANSSQFGHRIRFLQRFS